MPMRHELVISRIQDREQRAAPTLFSTAFLAVAACCLAGALFTLVLAFSYQPFAQVPLLIQQYNLG